MTHVLKILLEAAPIAAFLVGYMLGDIYVATLALLAVSVCTLAIGWRLEGRLSLVGLFTLTISLVLGGLTLALRDPDFIKLKPTIVFAIFAAGLVGSHFVGPRVLLARMLHPLLPFPEPLFRRLNLLWGGYFAVQAVLNLYVAQTYPEGTWVQFKIFGFAAMTALLLLLHLPLLRRFPPKTLQSPQA